MKKQSKAAQIRTLLAEGLSVKEIAKKLKFAEAYVAQVKWHWKKAAVQKPEKKAKKIKIEKLAGELFVQEYEKMRAEEKAAQQIDWKGNDWVVEISDPVNHPDHYKVGGIETIDFIEAKGLGYNLGNVVKYITRADHKGHREQDLNKALWYLSREIDKFREF